MLIKDINILNKLWFYNLDTKYFTSLQILISNMMKILLQAPVCHMFRFTQKRRIFLRFRPLEIKILIIQFLLFISVNYIGEGGAFCT